jgi:probable F420-dependent oxidoreductase
MRPFRFGAGIYWAYVHPKDWVKTVQHIEELGYSTVFRADHFNSQAYDPIVLLSVAAAATEKLNLGTLVFDVDYRHPVIYARVAAALHLLSNGRFEFGIGAGWAIRDYKMSGIPFDKPLVRIRRLDEALTIIRSMWIHEETTFKGKHYQVKDMVKAGELPPGDHPKIMVGGGGKRLLSVAGKHADIVGIHWPIPGGRFSGDSILDASFSKVKERIEWVKESARKAGRNLEEIEYQMLFPYPEITDEPDPIYERIAKTHGVSVDDVKDCPLWLIGSKEEIVDKLRMIRDETGISYMVFGPGNIELFDQLANNVMSKLT